MTQKPSDGAMRVARAIWSASALRYKSEDYEGVVEKWATIIDRDAAAKKSSEKQIAMHREE